MFAKILIANRGEIACRIIRTARRMGLATVALFSEADRDSLHVEMADEAVAIGPAAASESYLNIERIVAACRSTGAAAVHPGYGFLSESAAFAEALTAAGIVFIGPSADAIAAMGDKIASKKLAANSGVAIIPGYPGAIRSDRHAIAVADEIGLPVMIKASAGGGGKGMRVAFTRSDVREGLRAARAEARSAFGDDRILIERYIENPRHIEIQVLGDKHGNLIHLGERECSIQRRSQKVIEEAPSPAVDAKLRTRMTEQALALAGAVSYDSAGTVEFILDADRRFYFLEMNTRLQVEHAVTELVTGIDLVEQMIRVAAGEPLGLVQKDVRLQGWAVEARLYAEDPARDFLPSIGRLDRYQPPPDGAEGDAAVRIDSGVEEGSAISIHYDPLIAKVVTHGRTRAQAIDAMGQALDRFVIDGVASNRAFLAAVMANMQWRAGRLSTGFIKEQFPEGFGAHSPAAADVVRLATVALAVEVTRRRRLATLPGRLDGEGGFWRRDWVVQIGAQRLFLSAHAAPDGALAIGPRRGRSRSVVSDWRPPDPIWSGEIDGQPMTVQVSRAPGGLCLSWRGATVIASVMTPQVAELAALVPKKRVADSSRQLRCPMPGLVVHIHVAIGQRVRSGEPLAAVEAMKMENVLRAEQDATVAAILVEPGDTLAVDAVIMEFE